MEFFEDRQSKNPGRFTMTDAEGKSQIVTLERSDNPIVPGTPLNAATFNTMIRSLSARNLLDNGDFRHPVNQRGGELYVGSGYTIDRWRIAKDLEMFVFDNNIQLTCVSASTRNGMTQEIAPENTPAAGAPVTVAYEDDSGDIYTATGEMPETGTLSLFEPDFVGVNLYAPDGDAPARLSLMIPPGLSVGLRWLALYDGEFDERTLPRHRADRYSAELMECMRYFQICSTGDIPAADLRPTMRAQPTVTKIDGGYAYSAQL